MTMRQNSEYGNEWDRNSMSRYGYGFNRDPLGYNKSWDNSSRDFDNRSSNDSTTKSSRKQDYCNDRSSRCNSLNHIRPPQSNSWFDAWSLSNKGNRYSLINDLLPQDTMMYGGGLKNLPSCLNNNTWGVDSLFQGRHLDDSMIVSENEKEYLITLAIPGCDRKDISVNIREHNDSTSYLDVSWHFAKQSRSDNERVLWMGKTWGSGSRSFPIPARCDKNSIRADMKNGSLVIAIPKERRSSGGRNGRNKSINLY